MTPEFPTSNVRVKEKPNLIDKVNQLAIDSFHGLSPLQAEDWLGLSPRDRKKDHEAGHFQRLRWCEFCEAQHG